MIDTSPTRVRDVRDRDAKIVARRNHKRDLGTIQHPDEFVTFIEYTFALIPSGGSAKSV